MSGIGGGGSSPHTWGILIQGSRSSNQFRFIPTYVGHTAGEDQEATADAVHPHIRGAYYMVFVLPRIPGGSSPHTWGIRISIIHSRLLSRFIPTYVGHTLLRSSQAPGYSVHPHIRGAYLDTETIGLDGAGSSPHTWGIRRGPARLRLPDRFIPTYVGHTGGVDEGHAVGRFIPTYVGHTGPFCLASTF